VVLLKKWGLAPIMAPIIKWGLAPIINKQVSIKINTGVGIIYE